MCGFEDHETEAHEREPGTFLPAPQVGSTRTLLLLGPQLSAISVVSLLVRATQTMAFGVARGVLRDPGMAEDAVQNAYLRAFRRLADLEDAAARRSARSADGGAPGGLVQ
jgi:hypothetical protein